MEGLARFAKEQELLALSQNTLMLNGVTLPIYIQTFRGMSATISGIVMMPGAILGAVAGYFAGILHDKFGARWLSIIGVLMLALGSLSMAMFGFETSVTFIIVIYCMRSVGLMFANTPMNIWALGKLPDNILHHGSAL